MRAKLRQDKRSAARETKLALGAAANGPTKLSHSRRLAVSHDLRLPRAKTLTEVKSCILQGDSSWFDPVDWQARARIAETDSMHRFDETMNVGFGQFSALRQ
jgi:hypothetical protein